MYVFTNLSLKLEPSNKLLTHHSTETGLKPWTPSTGLYDRLIEKAVDFLRLLRCPLRKSIPRGRLLQVIRKDTQWKQWGFVLIIHKQGSFWYFYSHSKGKKRSMTNSSRSLRVKTISHKFLIDLSPRSLIPTTAGGLITLKDNLKDW